MLGWILGLTIVNTLLILLLFSKLGTLYSILELFGGSFTMIGEAAKNLNTMAGEIKNELNKLNRLVR